MSEKKALDVIVDGGSVESERHFSKNVHVQFFHELCSVVAHMAGLEEGC